jgi:hypothetical protein
MGLARMERAKPMIRYSSNLVPTASALRCIQGTADLALPLPDEVY